MNFDRNVLLCATHSVAKERAKLQCSEREQAKVQVTYKRSYCDFKIKYLRTYSDGRVAFLPSELIRLVKNYLPLYCITSTDKEVKVTICLLLHQTGLMIQIKQCTIYVCFPHSRIEQYVTCKITLEIDMYTHPHYCILTEYGCEECN